MNLFNTHIGSQSGVDKLEFMLGYPVIEATLNYVNKKRY
jgi:hypothetical protein